MRLLTYIVFVLVNVIENNTRPPTQAEIKRFLKQKQNLWEQSGQYQGDIRRMVMERNVIENTASRWPNKEIPYEISDNFTQQNKEMLKKALDYISTKTCVKTRPRTVKDQGSIFISPDSGHGCSSNIGYWKRTQIVYLDQVLGCVQFGVIVHELLHVLGLWHQQSAHNRDDYLDIVWDNVKPGTEHNFDKAEGATTSFGYKYDFNSIMHYTAYAFSKNGKPTIVPKSGNDGTHMGQRQRLSRIDIAKVKMMYDC